MIGVALAPSGKRSPVNASAGWAGRWRRLELAAVGVMIVWTLLLTPVGSELGLTDSARASTDIDPCGTVLDESTTAVNAGLGFQVGSGPAALQCGFRDIGFPPFLPEDVPVQAPDAGNIDPAFNSGFPYMIGPDGAEVSYRQITATQIIVSALTAAGASITISGVSAYLFPPVSFLAAAGGAVVSALVGALEAVVQDLIEEEEAMQGADWDWTVPSNTGTGDWYSWFTWSGTGGFVGDTPAITPSSVDPALVNWYSYPIDDPYYQSRPPVPYARVYLGATRVTMQQGPGITSTAETFALAAFQGEGPCAGRVLPDCLGSRAARSASVSSVVSQRRERGVGKAIKQVSAARDSIRGTSRNDEVSAPKRVDIVRAGAGHDQVLAGNGGNELQGGRGSDELTSFAGGDRLKGGSRHDVLQGGPGSDVSIGSSGSDSLFDAQGKDRMFAGPDDDRIVVRDDGDDDDRVHCGSGTDMVIADPGDRIVLTDAAKRSTVPVGAFTADHTPRNSTCERVHSSVHPPPREPPSIGQHAGRPPDAPEPSWPVVD